jgi:hypothetical protein
MTKQVTAFFTILIFSTATSLGQSYEPLYLAQKIFAKHKMPNLSNYITGEYKGRPNGRDLQKGTKTKFMLLGQTENTAVVAMTILDSAEQGLDTYLHFEKNKIWKMSAFRSLALTGMIEGAKIYLEKLSPQQVDSIIAIPKSEKNDGVSLFSSREEYDFSLGNAKLTLELDDNIIKHFLTNQNEFERLRDLALAQLDNEKVPEEGSIKLIENSKSDYQKLFISSISTGSYELGNCINFLIGGMVDNSVGYIYVRDGNDLPKMSPNVVIMIREIGNGWYIYKTT